jgi:hypothetical protein
MMASRLDMALPSRRGGQANNIAVARGHTNPVAASNVDRNPPRWRSAPGTARQAALKKQTKHKQISPAGPFRKNRI